MSDRPHDEPTTIGAETPEPRARDDEPLFPMVDATLDSAEHGGEGDGEARAPWKVLVVDDDADIHAVTGFALRRLTFDGRGVTFLRANSAAEALAVLSSTSDIAVALVDVVMETDHAGLDLVRAIREDLKDSLIRIVLRTGQPGVAPERQVISDHDINGYLDKAEATVDRLHAAVTTAIRSHRDLKRLDDGERGLRRTIEATAAAFAEDSIAAFSSSALRWLSGLMGAHDGRAPSGFTIDPDDDMRVTAATGRFADKVGLPLARMVEAGSLPSDVAAALADGGPGFRGCDGGPSLSAELRSSTGARDVIHIERAVPADALERDLLRLFTANLTIAHDNLHLRADARRTERDLASILTRVMESHDPETGRHDRRVAEMARLMGEAMVEAGLDVGDLDPEVLGMAAGLHDLGMITVPPAITAHPGPLGAEAWRALRGHCRAGHGMLRRSTTPAARLAATIALTHHERWDGRGYPDGLSGEAIPLAGRVTALTDQFDAMLSPRPHRAALTEEKAVAEVIAGRGGAYDPTLVDLLLNRLDAIRAVRHRFADDGRRTNRS